MEQKRNEEGDPKIFSYSNIEDKAEVSEAKTEDLEVRPAPSPLNQWLDCNALFRAQLSQAFLERQSLISFVETDGEYIVSAGRDHEINVWDATDGRHVRRLSGHDGPVTGLRLYGRGTTPPFQRVIVSASEDGSVRKWSLEKGEEMGVYYTGNVITCMGVMDNLGDYLAVTGNSKGVIEVRHLKTGELHSTVLGHMDPIDALVVDGDHACSATFDDPSSLKVWEIRRGRIACVYRIEGTPDLEFCSVAMRGDRVFLGAFEGQKLQAIDFRTEEKALVLLGNGGCKVEHVRVWNNWIFSCSSGKKHVVLDVHRMDDYQHFGTFSCSMTQAVAVAAMESFSSLKIVLGGSALAVLSFHFKPMQEDSNPLARRLIDQETSNSFKKKNKGLYTMKKYLVDDQYNDFSDSDESSYSFQEMERLETTGKRYESHFLKSKPSIHTDVQEVKIDNYRTKTEELSDDIIESKKLDGLLELHQPIKRLSLNPPTLFSEQRIFDKVPQYLEEPRMVIKRLEKILDEDNELGVIEESAETTERPKTCAQFIDDIIKKHHKSDEDFHAEKEVENDRIEECKDENGQTQDERPNETKQVKADNDATGETLEDLKIPAAEIDEKPKNEKKKSFFNKGRKSGKKNTQKSGHKRCEIM